MDAQDKPLILAMKDAEQELVAEVNAIMTRHKLPFYLFEYIFDKLHRQIKEGARGELDAVTTRKQEGDQNE